MNKSRIRRLEKRIMPEPDIGPRYLTVMKSFSKENYWCKDVPGRFFPSKEEVLEAWEAEHPGELEIAEDDGQFFGYGNVAAGKLDKYIDFVLVPAVREASSDAADERQSALRGLVDAGADHVA